MNIVPAECVFDFEIRYLPEDPVEPISNASADSPPMNLSRR